MIPPKRAAHTQTIAIKEVRVEMASKTAKKQLFRFERKTPDFVKSSLQNCVFFRFVDAK